MRGVLCDLWTDSAFLSGEVLALGQYRPASRPAVLWWYPTCASVTNALHRLDDVDILREGILDADPRNIASFARHVVRLQRTVFGL